MFLSDTQWRLLQPLFPHTSRGRPSLDDRLVLESIFLKLTSRLPWYDLPATSPSWQTCYQRFHRWQRTGTWKSIIKTLYVDLSSRGGLDLQALLDQRQISIERDPAGQLGYTYPPHLEGTWQVSTAFLIIQMLLPDL